MADIKLCDIAVAQLQPHLQSVAAFANGISCTLFQYKHHAQAQEIFAHLGWHYNFNGRKTTSEFIPRVCKGVPRSESAAALVQVFTGVITAHEMTPLTTEIVAFNQPTFIIAKNILANVLEAADVPYALIPAIINSAGPAMTIQPAPPATPERTVSVTMNEPSTGSTSTAVVPVVVTKEDVDTMKADMKDMKAQLQALYALVAEIKS